MEALLIVDIQNDFLPGGALAVPHGDEVIPIINALQEKFDCILATKDWHPKNHVSFAATHHKKIGESIEMEGYHQMLWPVHCVQNTQGAAFAESLTTDKIQKIIFKGVEENLDSYSSFYDNLHVRSTHLSEYLKKNHIDSIYIAGLATDYCVLYSVLDAIAEGFKTYVIMDACQGIDKKQTKEALRMMEEAGAICIKSFDVKPSSNKKTGHRT